MTSVAPRERSGRRRHANSTWLTPSFLFAALVVGGAGVGYPLIQLVLELLSILVVARVALSRDPKPRDRVFQAILTLFVMAFALPVLQLIPLPPALWHALPGRQTAVQVYAALGWAQKWHPASLTPDATLRSMLAMLPPLAAFLAVAVLTTPARLSLLRILVGVALVATLLAVIQVMIGGGDAPVLFETAHRGFGVGLFVNRNHQACFLLVAIMLAVVPDVLPFGTGRSAAGPVQQRVATLGVVTFLALGVLATASRTGLALLPGALLLATVLVFDLRNAGRWLVGAAAVYGLAGALLYHTPIAQQGLERFSSVADDLRYQYWDNSRFMIAEALPWGTGFGSFEAMYRAAEPLAQVSPLNVQHAHSDYLELALEGGVPAILLMGAGLVVLVLALGLAWRRASGRAERSMVAAIAAGIALILLCSVVDFPLRMTSMAVTFGVLLGCVVRCPDRPATAAPILPDRRATRIVVGLAAMLLGALSLTSALSLHLLRHQQPALAARLTPWSAQAWSRLAIDEQAGGRAALAAVAARHALALSPLDDAAIRALGYAEIAGGDPARGGALLQTGAALGWHEPLIQVWLVQQSLGVANLPVAVQRIDALLRRGTPADPLQEQLRLIFPHAGGVDALAARLAVRPPWRQGFLNAIADDAPAVLPQILALTRALRAAGAPVDPAETALIRWRLADAGDYDAVRQIWRQSGGRSLIGDSDFAMVKGLVPAGAAPYAWRAPNLSGVHVSVTEAQAGGAGRSVAISSDGYGTGTVLAQTIALEPGAYRLIISMRGAAGAPPARWSMSCLPQGALSPQPALELVWDAPEPGRPERTGRFNVGAGCAGQVLALAIEESSGQSFTVQLDKVKIERIPG